MRVAAIRYINTLPLIYGLRKNPGPIDLILDTPSACYQHLNTGKADVALIPVFATQLNNNLLAVPGVGIASISQTESVLLFARKPLNSLKGILADSSSLTSVNLLRIILKLKFGITPHIHHVAKPDPRSQNSDAFLIIGDDAILNSKEARECQIVDLGTEWYSLTGLPFVFAVWAASEKLPHSQQQLLVESLEQGLSNQDEIIEEATTMIGVDRDFLKRYYNHDLHYQLTPSDYKGLAAYLTLAADLRIIEKVRLNIWM